MPGCQTAHQKPARPYRANKEWPTKGCDPMPSFVRLVEADDGSFVEDYWFAPGVGDRTIDSAIGREMAESLVDLLADQPLEGILGRAYRDMVRHGIHGDVEEAFWSTLEAHLHTLAYIVRRETGDV